MAAISDAEFFVNVAILAGRRSADPAEKLGACLVTPTGGIAAVGHSTSAPGIDLATASAAERALAVTPPELNAVLAAGDRSRGCVAYLVRFPTCEGAKALAAGGIAGVYFLQGPPSDDAQVVMAKRILDGAKIRCDGLQSAENQSAPQKPSENKEEAAAQAPATSTATTAAQSTEAAPKAAPATPQIPAPRSGEFPTAFFATAEMSLQDTAAAVAAAGDGDFLIRVGEGDTRVLVIKDSESSENVRMYTMKPDGGGSWVFGGHRFPSMRSVVKLLQHKPIKSKTGKMLRLGKPAPGGETRDEGGPAEPATPKVETEDDSCTIM